jgi:hypothetical protein
VFESPRAHHEIGKTKQLGIKRANSPDAFFVGAPIAAGRGRARYWSRTIGSPLGCEFSFYRRACACRC